MRRRTAYKQGLHCGFGDFGQNIAGIVNTALLAIAYVLGVGITWLVAKIGQKRFLDLEPAKRKSYWIRIAPAKSRDDFYRQF